MESQFTCGKCGRPIASKFAKCLDCGSLGPHNFNSQDRGPAEESAPQRPAKRRDTYPADRLAPEPPQQQPRERFVAPEPMDAPVETPKRASHEVDEDHRFPAGMRHRSPILESIEQMDGYESKEAMKSGARETARETREESEGSGSYASDESEERPAAGKPDNKVTLIVTVTFILVLIIAAIFVISNFDEITRWLASTTTPGVVRPSN